MVRIIIFTSSDIGKWVKLLNLVIVSYLMIFQGGRGTFLAAYVQPWSRSCYVINCNICKLYNLPIHVNITGLDWHGLGSF